VKLEHREQFSSLSNRTLVSSSILIQALSYLRPKPTKTKDSTTHCLLREAQFPNYCAACALQPAMDGSE